MAVGYLKRGAAVAGVAALLCAVAVAPRARADDVTAQIQAAYENQCRLVQAGNYDGFVKTMTPDFVNVDPAGRREDRERIVEDVVTALQTLSLQSCEADVTSATAMAGGMALADVTLTQTGTAQTPHGAIPVTARTVENDTWILTGGVWLMKSSTVTQETLTVDGKQIDLAATPGPSASPAASAAASASPGVSG